MGPPGSGIRRNRRRATPSRIELSAHPNASHTQDGEPSGTSEIMAPHARFFIRREKSMVSMKFDPPVSGRYILLKLWSPARDKNIDIQSIVVHGFAGPRFFPAVELM